MDKFCFITDKQWSSYVETIEAQKQRIAELEAALKAEMYRHDRYVDFELAEAEELRQVKEDLRLAMEQLENYGCDTCKYEELSPEQYPCYDCNWCTGDKDMWEWKKVESK